MRESVAGLARRCVSLRRGGPQGPWLQQELLTITTLAVISNRRIDRLESVREADGTAPG